MTENVDYPQLNIIDQRRSAKLEDNEDVAEQISGLFDRAPGLSEQARRIINGVRKPSYKGTSAAKRATRNGGNHAKAKRAH